jgi:cytochrome c oxidase subunit 2
MWGLAAVLVSMPPAAALANIPRPNWDPGPPWAPLAPQSSEMHEISNLFWIMAIISGVVLAAVVFMLVYSIVNFTGKEGDPEPRQIFGNRQVEILWTIIPTLILLFAFGATVKAIHDINSAGTGKVLQIRAIGHQWWWEFQYPSLGIETANEVHVPTGTQIHFHVESYDVMHSFWIPQLTRQIDANPGQDNAVYTVLNTPGVFDGACYEYCGVEHTWMKFRAVVQTPAQFTAWAKHEAKPQSPTASPLATQASLAAGQKVFLGNTCVECHAIQGTTAGGVVGPNLTHVGSRWSIAAGAVPLDKQNLMAWIGNPSRYKAGVNMPGYPTLTQKQLSALADYLLSLK